MKDKIEISLSISTEEESISLDSTVLINGVVIQQYTDFSSFMLSSKDNRCWHTKKYFPNNKQIGYSYFYPFTCSCGEAGCASIWEGIHSKHRKHSVEWRIPKECGYDFLDKTFYSFDKEQYESEIDKCWKFLEDNKEVVLREEIYYNYLDEEYYEDAEMLSVTYDWLLKLKGKI